MEDSRYDFDCNSRYTGIAERPSFDSLAYATIDPWFLAPHPLHDQREDARSAVDGETLRGGSKKRKSSICGPPEVPAHTQRENDDNMASQLEAYRSKKTVAAGSKVDSKRAPLADVKGVDAANSAASNKKARVESAPQRSQPGPVKAKAKAVPATKAVPSAPIPKATPLHKAPIPSSSSRSALAVPAAKKSGKANPAKPLPAGDLALDGFDDMEALLKQHNKKFQAKAHYEPSLHSVRAVRKWEASSGRLWATLSTEERQAANADIAKLLAGADR